MKPSSQASRFAFVLSVCFLLLTSRALHAQAGNWAGTWASAQVSASAAPVSGGVVDETLREVVHVSTGGSLIRFTVSNEFSSMPLMLGGASVALRKSDSDLRGAPLAVTFNGKATTVIPAGASMVSDPIAMKVAAMSDIAVSLFIPAQPMTTVTQHGYARSTNYTAPGNQLTAMALTGAKETVSWRYLSEVDISEPGAASIVCFGDSITDGAQSTKDANRRWPDLLAARLQADKKTAKLGVLNEGIGGNRVLHDGTGPNALARFDRDVLAKDGVRYLIILEGTNDIGHAADPVKPYDVVSADDLIAGFTQMARRAHAHGIKVFGATVTPYVGAKYASPAGEAMRLALNQWIRTTAEIDGIIDFEKAARDRAKPDTIAAFADSGDHLHPNDAGYKAMADAIDLKLFQK